MLDGMLILSGIFWYNGTEKHIFAQFKTHGFMGLPEED